MPLPGRWLIAFLMVNRGCIIAWKNSPSKTRNAYANKECDCAAYWETVSFTRRAATFELHQLHQRQGCFSPSYVLPVPVSLRRKGCTVPIFGKQVTMLMFQLLPEQLQSTATVVTALKAQTTHAMRIGLIESGYLLSGMFRFLPLSLYMWILKRGMGGEICSLFYGDTATVNPGLEIFLGVRVADFTAFPGNRLHSRCAVRATPTNQPLGVQPSAFGRNGMARNGRPRT